VHVRGRAWLVERSEAGGASVGATDGTLTAPMTGKVLEVLVAEGDSVSEGQPLLVLSAMKMRLEIKAPHAGIVRRLGARAGDQVEGGDTMVVVEAAP
jgi:biotin carboxyl carrier protein